MKISEHFGLNKQQFELDFIDVNLDIELPLFLDAHVFSKKNDIWSKKCFSIIDDFFRKVYELIELDRLEELLELCKPLREPNETCLGYSTGKPRGAFQKPENMAEIFKKLYDLKAKDKDPFDVIKSLSDLKLFIEDVGNDTVSDIITNLIRLQLIEYTNDQCKIFNIKTQPRLTKSYWDDIASKWEIAESVEQLIINNKRILLVPKAFVFYDKFYTFKTQHFAQHDVLDFLQYEELKIKDSPLIRHRKPKKKEKIGEPFVTKKDLRAREDVNKKDYLLQFCKKYPKILNDFKNKEHFQSLTLPQFYEIECNKLSTEDYNSVLDAFINTLKSIPIGRKHAYEYHDFILGVLTFIFYPSLSNPKKETPIDEEKKRIDISFINTAETGFFKNIKNEIVSNYIYVECKNYSDDVSNPEFDQLAARFNTSSCRVGLLVCRSINDYSSARKKISGHYRRQGNLILPITDKELIIMLEQKKIKKIDENQLTKHEDTLFDIKRSIEVEHI